MANDTFSAGTVVPDGPPTGKFGWCCNAVINLPLALRAADDFPGICEGDDIFFYLVSWLFRVGIYEKTHMLIV